MSLKPLQTHYSQVSSLYAPYTASGGGGGGGGSVIVASTLTISSITGVSGLGPYFTNGLEIGAAGELSLEGGLGVMVGVSSINGAAYPPPAAAAAISTITTGGGSIGADQLANLNPVALTTTLNKWYMASLEITDMTFVTQPAATDCFNIRIEDATGQTNLGTFNMAQVSTNRGIVGDMGFSVSGPYEALSTNAYFTYKSNTGAASTFLVTGGTGWLQPLN